MKPEQLEKFRGKLQELDNRLVVEIQDLSVEIANSGVTIGEHDSCSSESKDAEIVVERIEEKMQEDVQAALRRIAVGTFGQCVDCGGKIILARLDAIPYTPVCIKCETKREASS